MQCSLIIPTLNEAGRIGKQVAACAALRPRPEVIVVDGGSRDDTRLRASRAGARVIAAPRRGRAPQMNAGARAAAGDVLLFLHADVSLPQAAFGALQEALGDSELLGGAFRRRFDSSSLLLDLGCRLADARGRRLRVYLGDQALFVRREAFDRLGGFREMLLFEDLEFSRRLARLGKTRLIEEPIVASGRRFEKEGALRRLSRNLWLTALYLAGGDPDRLARRYYPGYYPLPEEAGSGPSPSSPLRAAGSVSTVPDEPPLRGSR
jgi:rSAM/selenodomain-associated transferase 2